MRCLLMAKAHDYQDGYDAFNDGEKMDRSKSYEWQAGWCDANDDANLHEDFF